MIGPDASAIARLTVATSSPSDVRGSCTAVTECPLAARSGITFAQLDPSAQAPCTRITSDDFAISSSPQCVRLPRLGTAWLRRVLIFNTPTHVRIASYSAIRATPTELDKAATWPWRIQSQPEAPPHSDARGGRKGGINDMARRTGVRLGLRAWPH